jgi:DNA-binding XRE family transcriptional regulator
MAKNSKRKEVSSLRLNEVEDLLIGKRGSALRNKYELDLRVEELGWMIRQARMDRKLTQEELGDMVGVKRAQISRLENHPGNISFSTVLRIFNALHAKVRLQVEL